MTTILSSIFSIDGVQLALIIVGIILGFFIVFGFISKIIIAIRYSIFNNTFIKAGLSVPEFSQRVLSQLQLNDVKVVESGFFNTFLYGNSYHPRSKEIRLRKNIYNEKTITAIGVAGQKIAQAVMHNNKEKKFSIYTKLRAVVWSAPLLYIPLILIGILLDVAFNTSGILFLTFFAFASLYYLMAFVFLLVSIPVEKRSAKIALDIFSQTNILEPEELNKVKKFYRTYILSTVVDFIISLLYIIWYILKIVVKLKLTKK